MLGARFTGRGVLELRALALFAEDCVPGVWFLPLLTVFCKGFADVELVSEAELMRGRAADRLVPSWKKRISDGSGVPEPSLWARSVVEFVPFFELSILRSVCSSKAKSRCNSNTLGTRLRVQGVVVLRERRPVPHGAMAIEFA